MVEFCWDIDGLFEEPFLAINVTNKEPFLLEQNSSLFKQHKTGYWKIRSAVVDLGLEGRKIFLLFKEGDVRSLYEGRIRQLTKTDTEESDDPRYEIEAISPWKKIAETRNTFSGFFGCYKVGSGNTYLWGCESSLRQTGGVVEDNDSVDDLPLGYDEQGTFARRVGHQFFVNALKRVWGNECSLTGLSAPRLVQACHVIPWTESSSQQKVSADNGLLLCAHLHALFDEHLIGFDRNGDLLLDSSLSSQLVDLIVSTGRTKLRLAPSAALVDNLSLHSQKNANLVLYAKR
jgi:hypothetical protein